MRLSITPGNFTSRCTAPLQPSSALPTLLVNIYCQAFGRIRNWRLLIKISEDKDDYNYYDILRLSVGALQILLSDRWMCLFSLESKMVQTASASKFQTSSRTSRFFGEFKSFKIQDAESISYLETFHHFVQDVDMDDETIVSALIPYSNTDQAYLLHLGTGNSPVEFTHEMYSSLLHYVKFFESYAPFKVELDTDDTLGEILHYATLYSKPKGLQWTNLFKGHEIDPHPVENGLRIARRAVRILDVATFKVQRTSVLEYLEPQYQRMSSASTNILQFVKAEKTSGGLFDCDIKARVDYSKHKWKFVEALLLLEDYYQALERDMPLEVRKIIREYTHQFSVMKSEDYGATTLAALNNNTLRKNRRARSDDGSYSKGESPAKKAKQTPTKAALKKAEMARKREGESTGRRGSLN